jgi:hypothetical protein
MFTNQILGFHLHCYIFYLHILFLEWILNVILTLNLVNLLLFKVFYIIDIFYNCCGFFADPSPSVTKDKSRPDLAGSPSDGLLPPDGDKAFYENLPFHGMQSAPNKVNTLYIMPVTCIPLLTEETLYFSSVWIYVL